MYLITLETFNGEMLKLNLPTKNSVMQFVEQYQEKLPTNISIKFACDALGLRGTLRGKASK